MHDPAQMPARLAAFLQHEEPDVDGISVTGYDVMTGGYSRLLARATTVWRRGTEATTRTFVLRGDPPADRQLISTDRRVEHDVLRLVQDRLPTSRVHYFDSDGEHLGTPTLVLEDVAAASLLPYMAGRDDNRDLVLPLADVLGAFHTIAVEDLPPALVRPKDWDSYLTARIDEWRSAALDHVEPMPIMRYVAAWLDAHRPPPVELTLIHGDFQSANLMVDDQGRIVVLDWELAQVGDPREDLGYFRAVAQAAGPDVTALDEEAFCTRYRELTGMNDNQLNPGVITYFVVLGVVGTVRRLLEGGAAYVRGQNHLLTSVFNLNSIQFGQRMWMSTLEALEGTVAQPTGAS